MTTLTTTVGVDTRTTLHHRTIVADDDRLAVYVDLGDSGPTNAMALSLRFDDAADLERLAAELLAAANCLTGLGCGEPA